MTEIELVDKDIKCYDNCILKKTEENQTTWGRDVDDTLRNQKNQAELLEMKTALDGLTADETTEKSLVNLRPNNGNYPK